MSAISTLFSAVDVEEVEGNISEIVGVFGVLTGLNCLFQNK